MKVRYKSTGTEANASQFNMHGVGEVLTGDDSVYVSDLDIYIERLGIWKDMHQAFIDKDIIADNYHKFFLEPPTEKDCIRGYIL